MRAARPPPARPLTQSGLRTAPAPRTFYSPDTTPHRHNPPRAAAAAASAEQRQNIAAMNGVNGHFPQFQPSALNAPIARPVATPRNVPHEFMTPKRAPPDTNGVAASARYGAGFIGPDPMHRITMSLKSGLSSEIEFALSYLVRVSFEYGDRLLVDAYPGLPELLFAKVQSVEKLVHEFHMQGQRDNVDHATFTRHLEKINEAALVLRNMSFQPDNAKAFAALHYPKDIIVMGLSLSNHANLIELKQYLLDVVETMANDLPFTQQDPLFDVLCPGLLSDDRGLLLGSLRAICRLLVGRDEYNRVSEISDAAILRIQSLLMVEDEELVSACLDFLYQYTSNDENVDKLLEPPSGIELMKHLVRLLLFQGITGEQIVYLKNVRKAPVQNREIPQLPQEIVNDLLGYTEPERATKWWVRRPPLSHTALTAPPGCVAASKTTPSRTSRRLHYGRHIKRASTNTSAPACRCYLLPSSSRMSRLHSAQHRRWCCRQIRVRSSSSRASARARRPCRSRASYISRANGTIHPATPPHAASRR